jgi:hypothetical protein
MTDLQKKSKKRWGRKFKDNRDWPSTNESYVIRGMYLLDLSWIRGWDEELAMMNEHKIGRPYVFPESLIKLQGLWKAKQIPFRMIEGMTRQLYLIAGLPDYNDYTTVCRRVNTLNVQLELPKDKVIELAFEDGTGHQAVNGGEYLREKYGKKNRRWVQIVILGDPKTKEPIWYEVNIIPSSEPASAVKQLKTLKEHGITVKRFGGDGAMDDMKVWNHCERENIQPEIKPDKNARVDSESHVRNQNVIYRNKYGYKKWARKMEYGKRWPATEGIFSAVKRIFGEQLMARSERGLVKEAGLKIWAYKRLKNCPATIRWT